MRDGGARKGEHWGAEGRERRAEAEMMHEPAVGQRRATVPGDRELARSSPAFMVVNWIVKGGKMRGVKERGERRKRSYEGRREEIKRDEGIVCLCFPSLAWSTTLKNKIENNN